MDAYLICTHCQKLTERRPGGEAGQCASPECSGMDCTTVEVEQATLAGDFAEAVIVHQGSAP